MVEVSFINPLSNEGRQIVKEYGDLNKLFDEDETLVNEIIHTANQKISDDSLIPKSLTSLLPTLGLVLETGILISRVLSSE